ncbi:hypothetical protein GCM10011367_16730 [Marinicauda pacifica]|jgi:uncharacterized lipoprotein|nr:MULTISPECIES: hypothetical protein [Marinicauda]GGE42627.1 hypothetical protein GCM10011367_16730 [Marinicauda pacifica]
MKRTAFIVAALSSIGLLAACEDDGPMEEAGENVDEAVEDAGDELDG